MSVILVFIVVVLSLGGWWLFQHGLMSKPWLETGAAPDNGNGYDRAGPSAQKVALVVFLAVVGALFALFASAYYMRMEYADWVPLQLPRLVWLNTAMLVLASIALQTSLGAVRRYDTDTVKLALGTTAVATVAFLTGQVMAWRELASSGVAVSSNPSSSFFFMLTFVHGLHILGGLVALARTLATAWDGGPHDRLQGRIELCTTYWHFLLFVWLGIMVLLAGWANDFIAICRQLLT
jgi:cytochrome c oxidase subunit 3